MESAFNPAMLLLARSARQQTQGDLASNSGVTQALISKLENRLLGDPNPETVNAFAHALGFPEDFFYLDERMHGLPPFHYRKRSKLGAKALQKIEADINLRRMHIERLMRSYELSPSFKFPQVDLDETGWTPRQAARHMRGFWLVPRGPIQDLTQIIEEAGGIIVQINFETTHLDGISFRMPGLPPLIFMNEGVPGDRYRFSLAHELAHLILHNNPDTEDRMEKDADEFAAEFLMPAAEIRSYLTYPNLAKLARVKRYWRVSIKALIKQSYELKMITPSQYKGLNVNYSKQGFNRYGEPAPIEVEKPSTFANAIDFHVRKLGYSTQELARLLTMSEAECERRYLERPRLRVVK